jgi:hypothetical protein
MVNVACHEWSNPCVSESVTATAVQKACGGEFLSCTSHLPGYGLQPRGGEMPHWLVQQLLAKCNLMGYNQPQRRRHSLP